VSPCLSARELEKMFSLFHFFFRWHLFLYAMHMHRQMYNTWTTHRDIQSYMAMQTMQIQRVRFAKYPILRVGTFISFSTLYRKWRGWDVIMFAAWFEYIINSGRSIERGLIGWVLDIMKYFYGWDSRYNVTQIGLIEKTVLQKVFL